MAGKIAKVSLQLGERQEVTFEIDKEAFSSFDAQQHEWIVESGRFDVLVGAASDDIRDKVSFKLK